MKKVVLSVSTILLFVGLTFGQTPQTPEKTKSAATKTETPATKKDAKGGDKTCTHMGKSCAKDGKSGCCAKKGADSKKDVKTTTPEKK